MGFDPEATAEATIAKLRATTKFSLAQVELMQDICGRIALSIRVEGLTDDDIADVLAALTLGNDALMEAKQKGELHDES